MAVENSTAATSGRSGGVGASADSYIGSLISLTSKSEIRYEGILYNINTEESSIGLRNVRTYGTEGRKKDGPQVPPSDRIYEYILFRGSDIKDLQVKASPPVQTAPTINNDPAIIQSHCPRATTTPSTTLPTAPIGSLSDPASLSMQTGIPGSTFQSGLPLYQPGGSLNSWGPPQQNANGGSLPMSMYWQGFYGTPNVVPQLPQQSLLRPPPGPPIPPMQQLQFPGPGFNSFLPTTSSNLPSSNLPSSNLPSSNLPDIHPSMVPKGVNSSSLTTTSLPPPTFSLNAPPLMLGSIASETMINILPNRDPISTVPTSTLGSNMPSQGHLSTSVPDNVGVSSVPSRPRPITGPTALPLQNVSQPGASFSGSSNPILTETVTPSLITPGQLLQPGPATISATQRLQTMQKDVEGVTVASKTSSGPAARRVAEVQPPILPLPSNTQAQKLNGTAYHMRNSHRGFGGRESGVLHPVTKFAEDFDFTAMNEKFKKDEVWGDLGRSNKSVNGGVDKKDDIQDEDDTELPKPVYNKDDFFDTLSCNSLDNDPNHGRTRYSEQKKLDTETFGDISRYNRGGRGYRGGRFRGSYRGRGFGGYGYAGRGGGRGGRGGRDPSSYNSRG